MNYETMTQTIDDVVETAKAKPEPIENWENEGGVIIPTGSFPKIVFPTTDYVADEG